MLIRLHKKATTTPAIRDYIRTCGKPIKTLARELNLNVATVRKWRERESAQDASHRPHRMQTTLSRSQELLVLELGSQWGQVLQNSRLCYRSHDLRILGSE